MFKTGRLCTHVFVRAFKTCRQYVVFVNDLNVYHMFMYNIKYCVCMCETLFEIHE